MSLIGLLGNAGTAFVGGAAQQLNVGFDVAREAKAEKEQAIAVKEAELKATEAAEERERKRVAKEELEKRQRTYGYAVQELSALQSLPNLKGVPLIRYDENSYAKAEIIETGDTYLTEEQATAFSKAHNQRAAEFGYVQIPVPREDGKGFTVELKEIKDTEAETGFKTFGDAQKAANEMISYYEGIDAGNIIPIIDIDASGTYTVKPQVLDKDTSVNRLFKTFDEAQAFADKTMAYYESNDRFAGKFAPKIETTDDGIKVEIIQMTQEKAGDGKLKDSAGVEIDTNYLFKVSPKAGVDLSKGEYRQFDAISLTGNPIQRTGEDQLKYTEDQDFLVYRRQGIGDGAVRQNESFATFIQEDFTPEVIQKIEANRGSGFAGNRAHQAMVSTFRKFVNDFKDANTRTTTDHILERRIEDSHPWLAELAGNSPALQNVLQETPIDPTDPNNPIASTNPRNMPVVELDEGNARPLLPNIAVSPYVSDQDDGQGNMVPMLDQAFLNKMYSISDRTNVDAAELVKIVHTAENAAGQVTRESIKTAYENLVSMQTTLETKKFTEGGGYQDPGLSSDTQKQLLLKLEPYSTTNDKILALSAAIPELTVQRAGFNTQVAKNTSKKGKYEAVTGGAMEYKIVGEQLDNADNMMSSIEGLRGAIKGGGEVGIVLEAESLVTGGEYLLDTVMENLEFEEGTNGRAIVDGVRRQYNEAVAESDPQKRANALVRVYATMLSYQLARLMDPNGRLSDEDRRTVETAIGLKGIKATPDKLLLVAEELSGQVEYIQARNRAYQSGNIRTILAAHTYNNMSGGGNIKEVLPNIMSTITEDTAAASASGSGVTLSPSMQRALEIANQGSSTGATQNSQVQPNTPAPANVPAPNIPQI